MKKPVHVTLVEDHPEYREVIAFALSKDPDIEVVSQIGSAERALRRVKDQNDGAEMDIILLDLNLPGMSGLEAIPWFKKYSPETKVIILSQSDMEADVLRAIQLGASGYLLKSSTVNQITEGIRTVMDGGASLDPSVARFILNTLKTKLPKEQMEQTLSDREMEVLTLLADGLVKKEIAGKLGIGTSTVVTHVTHIYEKLDATNAPSAINNAHRLGLFPAEGEPDEQS